MSIGQACSLYRRLVWEYLNFPRDKEHLAADLLNDLKTIQTREECLEKYFAKKSWRLMNFSRAIKDAIRPLPEAKIYRDIKIV